MNEDEFRKRLYLLIRDRTVEVRNGSKMPFIGYKSARTFGRKYGFDPQPVTYALIELEKKGAIYKKYNVQRGQYEYIARR